MTPKRKANLAKGIFICTLAALFYCYEYLLRIIPGVMEAELRVAFGNISATSFGTLSAYYYFAYTPMQLPAGILMDRFGAKYLLVLACLMCAVGSWLFNFTGSLAIASLGRFFVGLGSAVAFIGVLTLAVAWLPKKYFSMVAGLVTMLGMFGAIGGQIGISYLSEVWGWEYLLNLAPIIGALLFVMLLIFLKDAPLDVLPEKRIHQSTREFLSELKTIFLDPQIWLVGFIGSLLFLSLSVFAEIWGKSYLMTAHGLTSLQASSSISMVFLGWAIGGPISGFLADYYHKRLTMLISGSLLAFIVISLILYMPHLTLINLDVLLFLYGLFCGVEIIVFAIAKDTSTSKMAGTVFACVNMIVMLGGVIFQPLVGELLDFFWDGSLLNQVRIYSEMDYQLVLSFLPLSLLGVSIAVFFVKDKS